VLNWLRYGHLYFCTLSTNKIIIIIIIETLGLDPLILIGFDSIGAEHLSIMAVRLFMYMRPSYFLPVSVIATSQTAQYYY